MWHVSQAFITHPSSHREDCLHCGDFLSIFLVSNSPWLLKYLWPPFTDSGRRPDAPGRTDDYWVESSQRGKPRDCLIVCLIGFRWFSTCFADIVLSFTSFFFQNYRFFISYLYSCWIRKIIYFGIKKRKWVQQIFIYLFFFPVASLPAAFFLPTGGLKAVSVGKATWWNSWVTALLLCNYTVYHLIWHKGCWLETKYTLEISSLETTRKRRLDEEEEAKTAKNGFHNMKGFFQKSGAKVMKRQESSLLPTCAIVTIKMSK